MLIMIIMIIVRILIIMIIVRIDNNDNSDNSYIKRVIIMTTKITVTIVITCLIQNGVCFCQNTWETPRKASSLIGSLCQNCFESTGPRTRINFHPT